MNFVKKSLLFFRKLKKWLCLVTSQSKLSKYDQSRSTETKAENLNLTKKGKNQNVLSCWVNIRKNEYSVLTRCLASVAKITYIYYVTVWQISFIENRSEILQFKIVWKNGKVLLPIVLEERADEEDLIGFRLARKLFAKWKRYVYF